MQKEKRRRQGGSGAVSKINGIFEAILGLVGVKETRGEAEGRERGKQNTSFFIRLDIPLLALLTFTFCGLPFPGFQTEDMCWVSLTSCSYSVNPTATRLIAQVTAEQKQEKLITQ